MSVSITCTKPFAELGCRNHRNRRLQSSQESPKTAERQGRKLYVDEKKNKRLLGLQPTLSNLAHLLQDCGTLVLWTLLCAFKPHPYLTALFDYSTHRPYIPNCCQCAAQLPLHARQTVLPAQHSARSGLPPIMPCITLVYVPYRCQRGPTVQ